MIKGQSPRNLVNLAQDRTQRQVLFDKIAPGLALKLRCQELVTKCSEAVLENGVRAMTLDQERSLDILLRRYESQVDELELQTVAGLFSRQILYPLPLANCFLALLQTMKRFTCFCAGWQSRVSISTRAKRPSPVDVFLALLLPLAV